MVLTKIVLTGLHVSFSWVFPLYNQSNISTDTKKYPARLSAAVLQKSVSTTVTVTSAICLLHNFYGQDL